MFSFVAAPPAVIEAVLSARQEVRARTTVDQSSAVVVDTETDPIASFQARTRSLRTWLTYAPRLTVRDIGITPSTLLLHTGAFGLTKAFPRVTLTLRQDGSFGSQNFAGGALATSQLTTQPVVSRLPSATNLDTYSLQTSLIAGYSPSARWSLNSFASYATGGGTTTESLAALPREYGPRAGVDTRYAITRRDGVVTTATYSLTGSSTGARSTIATLSAGWAHAFGTHTTMALLAGAAVTRTRPTTMSANNLGAAPIGSASVTHRPTSGRTSGRYTATVTMSPAVDRLTGRVAYRIDGTLNGTWPLAPRTSVLALAGGGRSFGNSDGTLPPITIIVGELSVGHSPWRWLRLDAGARATYQRADAIAGAPNATVSPSQRTLFVALTLSDTLRLVP